MWFKLTVMLAALAGLLSGVACAQQLPLRYLNQQDGLANVALSALAQDAAGYLWVGTENGLFRYNGEGFSRVHDAGGRSLGLVGALLADAQGQGRLWAGTRNGLYRIDGGRPLPVLFQGQPLPFQPGQKLAQPPGGGLLLVSGERLLHVPAAGATAGAYFSDDQMRRHAALDAIHSIWAGTDGQLWMGCRLALCAAGPQGVTLWDGAAGVPAERWLSVTRTADGVLWARGEHHIIALEPGAARFVDRTPPGKVMGKHAMVHALEGDADGRLLTSTDRGLARWRGGGWEFFDPGNGLTVSGGVTAILIDRDREAWIATRGHGLVRWLDYDNWENWTGAQGMPDDVVLSFARDGHGTMHIGTRSGPALLKRDGTRIAPVAGQAAQNWGSQAVDRQGQVWGGSYAGLLARHDPRSGTEVPVASLPLIVKLLVDREGRLWINTVQGIFVLEHPERGGAPRRPAGLAADSGLLRDQTRGSCQGADGVLWFLGWNVLWRHSAGRWDSFTLSAARDSADFDTLACAADGALWLGSVKTGLWRAQVERHGLARSQVRSPLLKDKVLLTVHEDSRGWLWLGTDAGVVVWNRAQWRQFSRNEGLVWDDLNARPLYEDTDGSMWLPTSNGASHVLHPERLFAPHQLSAVVEAGERDGQALALSEGDALAWSPGTLRFTLASLNFRQREALRFRYRLAGLEPDWTESAVPELRYAALPPGQYHLQYAVENAGMQSVSPTRWLGFSIRPPWWRTTAFYLLCGTAGAAALGFLHRYRMRAMRLRNAQMEKLVSDRTRELELSQEALRERVLRDGMTKAWNRTAMLEMLDQALRKSQRDRTPFLLILLDLDHFKRINDGHGHLAGDAVLCEVVRRLNASVRPYDLVGRYGGEEFLVLMPELGRSVGAGRVEAMRRAVDGTPFDIGDGRTLAVSASFGVAEFDPAEPVPALELVRRADVALYRAKARGRNRAEYAADA